MTGMSILGGLAGVAVAAVATSGDPNQGPGEFIPLDEPTARTMLAELQLVD
jgi:prolipoprotein diacylglyceryltransferase